MNDPTIAPSAEAKAVAERYARREPDARYNITNADVWQAVQERQRAMVRFFVCHAGWTDLTSKRLVEVGCGSGGNLLELLRMGFQPQLLTGLELLPERAAQARRVLPTDLQVFDGDALAASLDAASQDIVYQSVVFSSLLDDTFQQRLADRMWHWLRPGGAVLWYDFVYNNPANPDVRGVPLRRVRELFPQGIITARSVTLAPPIARRVAAVHPALYTLFNVMPLLRTHVLAWIAKPAEDPSTMVPTP